MRGRPLFFGWSRHPSSMGNRVHSFQPDVLSSLFVDATGIRDRASKIAKTRNPKKEYQSEWLRASISMMDLTTLEGTDTPGRVRRLCQKALSPIFGEKESLRVAAVCVYGNLVPFAKKYLDGSGVRVAAVSTSFPHGQVPLKVKVEETEALVEMGADEVDMVINRDALLSGDYEKMYQEIVVIKEVCGESLLKVILETGELGDLKTVWVASEIAMQAGADFIKTSTGKIHPGATLEASLVMLHAMDLFFMRTESRVGFKAAGGIRSAKTALQYMALVKETLGDAWLHPDLFRLGASTLLDDAARQLHHLKTGQYESYDYIPKG